MKVNISRLIREHETFNRGLLGEFPFGIGRGQIDIAGKTHQLHFSWVHPQYRVLRWVNDHNERSSISSLQNCILLNLLRRRRFSGMKV